MLLLDKDFFSLLKYQSRRDPGRVVTELQTRSEGWSSLNITTSLTKNYIDYLYAHKCITNVVQTFGFPHSPPIRSQRTTTLHEPRGISGCQRLNIVKQENATVTGFTDVCWEQRYELLYIMNCSHEISSHKNCV